MFVVQWGMRHKICDICGTEFTEEAKAGRPRVICGSKDCRREYKARNARQRRAEKRHLRDYLASTEATDDSDTQQRGEA